MSPLTSSLKVWGTQSFSSLGHEQQQHGAPSLPKLPDDPGSALSGKHKTLLPPMTEELFSISAQSKPCQQECPRSAVHNVVKHLLQSSHLPCTSHFWGAFVKSWLRTEPNWQDFTMFSYQWAGLEWFMQSLAKSGFHKVRTQAILLPWMSFISV